MAESRNPESSRAKRRNLFGELGLYANGHKQIDVVYTTWAGTRAALRMAANCAEYLDAGIVVWFLEVVPRQFALRRPPVSLEIASRRLSDMVLSCCSDLDVRVEMCLCNNFRDCLARNLKEDSIVVLGGRARWWRTAEEKLAEFLKTQDHVVLFVDTEEVNESAPWCGIAHQPKQH